MRELDWYLTQCDITQYQLRNSSPSQKERLTELSETIKLIIVASKRPTDKIYFDIIAAIHLTEDQVYHLTPSELMLSQDKIDKVTWFINETIPDKWQNGYTITTSNLEQLAQSPIDKRALWQQLCQYESLFK